MVEFIASNNEICDLLVNSLEIVFDLSLLDHERSLDIWALKSVAPVFISNTRIGAEC